MRVSSRPWGSAKKGWKLTALAREPFLPLVHLEIAMSYYSQRRYDDAVDWADRTLLLDETHALARELVTAASVARGDRRLERSEVFQPRSGLLGRAEHYRDGVFDYALRRTPSRRLADLHSAVLCSAAGETERAFQHLESAIDPRDSGLLRLAIAPQWDNLRSDPDSIGAWRGWDWLPRSRTRNLRHMFGLYQGSRIRLRWLGVRDDFRTWFVQNAA